MKNKNSLILLILLILILIFTVSLLAYFIIKNQSCKCTLNTIVEENIINNNSLNTSEIKELKTTYLPVMCLLYLNNSNLSQKEISESLIKRSFETFYYDSEENATATNNPYKIAAYASKINNIIVELTGKEVDLPINNIVTIDSTAKFDDNLQWYTAKSLRTEKVLYDKDLNAYIIFVYTNNNKYEVTIEDYSYDSEEGVYILNLNCLFGTKVDFLSKDTEKLTNYTATIKVKKNENYKYCKYQFVSIENIVQI